LAPLRKDFLISSSVAPGLVQAAAEEEEESTQEIKENPDQLCKTNEKLRKKMLTPWLTN